MASPDRYHPTQFWHRLDADHVQCDLCPRACRLSEGQRGLCYVRGCEHGAVVLHSWGRASGFCIDPIEKKPLNHFLPGTPILSFGTAGCNLSCKFCQNWSISKARQSDTRLAVALPEQIARTAQQWRCRSVAYTYNDPVIFMEYALDVASACREAGVMSVAVSAGYLSEAAREPFFTHMDAANIDLKGFSERFYKKLCAGSLAPVLDTLCFIRQSTQCWLELTTLLIPGENDRDSELEAMSEWILKHLGADTPLHFTAFHPDYKLLSHPPTALKSLRRARHIARQAGLNYVYTGNLHDAEGASTHCAHCSAQLIERVGYQLDHWGLDANGRCRQCGTPLPGRFEAQPGNWGNRRQPLPMPLV